MEEPPQVLASIEVETSATASSANATISSTQPDTPDVATRRESAQLSSPPNPLSDSRSPDWSDEKWNFKGKIVQDVAWKATESALAAQRADLWVNGKPHFAIFCDGSCLNPNLAQFHGDKGGYGVAFRDPYTPDEDDADLAFNKDLLRRFKVAERDGFTTDNFTIRQWLSRTTFTPSQAEACAVAQSIDEVAKRVKKNKRKTRAIRIQIYTHTYTHIWQLP